MDKKFLLFWNWFWCWVKIVITQDSLYFTPDSHLQPPTLHLTGWFAVFITALSHWLKSKCLENRGKFLNISLYWICFAVILNLCSFLDFLMVFSSSITWTFQKKNWNCHLQIYINFLANIKFVLKDTYACIAATLHPPHEPRQWLGAPFYSTSLSLCPSEQKSSLLGYFSLFSDLHNMLIFWNFVFCSSHVSLWKMLFLVF